MKILTVPQKMSGTGSIHDLASEHYDITVDMSTRYPYAVLTPSYFNIAPTRHKSAKTLMRRCAVLHGEGYPNVTAVNLNGDIINWRDGLYVIESAAFDIEER